MQRALLREEIEHGATRFATAQQAVQAESLAAAAVLHAALVRLESAQEAQARLYLPISPYISLYLPISP